MTLILFRQRKTQGDSNTPRRKRDDGKGHPCIVRMPCPMAGRVDLAVAEQSVAAANEDQGQTDSRSDGGLRRRLSPDHREPQPNGPQWNDMIMESEVMSAKA